ncbi:polysaccharide deacetylase family protein [Paenibacillus allorhizosphaerae]|uniref:NodB homology domain-containing protein n=1 Tax=Paenibacillus allorhizosphaerae TaxID=2849866 RepID=A0ABN7U0I8_9BACL|nr:polysaccharide deacetylase [Paenibacillus allorhizosphaerae]CAG7657751.1 hypothetical protein PAECIP111802_06850 [Paenibacillus allorhizosphaerae]
MMNDGRPNGLMGQLMRIWVWVCCIPLLFVTIGHEAAWAQSPADAGGTDVYAALKSGQRVELEKNYRTPDKPTVYLTFDDGPSKQTPQVLDILKQEEVKGTFFVLGEQVQAQQELVRRMVREGHAVGNHTYNHVYKELYADFSAFWGQIQRTEQAVEDAAGVRPRMVRAPGGTFGNFDPFYFYYLDQAGYEIYDWNIDSGDSARVGVPAKEIYDTVAKGPFRHEVVVLMHDSSGHGETVKALPQIIALFKSKGYQFEVLSPEVKPIHFSNGKPKWSRSVSPQGFDKFVNAAAEHQHTAWAELEEDGGTEPGMTIEPPPPTAIASAGPSSEAIGPDKLAIRMDERTLVLDKGDFRLHDGSYVVPLRKLGETMGASIEWLGEQRTAKITYGLYTAEYDMSKHELRIEQHHAADTHGSMKRIALPDMELIDGTLYVPLRYTVEWLGDSIAGYVMDNGQGQAEVRITQRGGRALPWLGMSRSATG